MDKNNCVQCGKELEITEKTCEFKDYVTEKIYRSIPVTIGHHFCANKSCYIYGVLQLGSQWTKELEETSE